MAAAFLAIPLATAQTAPETPAAIEATPDGTTAQAAQPSADSRPEARNAAPGGIGAEPQQPNPDTAASQANQPVQAETPEAQDAGTAQQSAPQPQQDQATGAGASQSPQSEAAAPAAQPSASEAVAPATEPSASEVAAPAAQPSASEAAAPATEPPASEAGPVQAQTVPDQPGADTNADAAEPAASTAANVEEAAPLDPKDVKLTIATWAGAYGQAQERAFFRPFAERSGYQLEAVTYDGDYAALEEQRDNPEWSLVDLNGEAMLRACDEQRLEPLDHSILEAAPDGAPLSEDFLPGAVHPCGVVSSAWSAIIVYDSRLITKPSSLADFFDIGNIPGKRLLPKQPRYSLELALMADGVPPDQAYAMLGTAAGQDRAFAKLSSIKDDIVWWEKPSQVFGRIVENEAVMGLAFNGRAFMAIVGAKQPLEILWDHQIYSYDYWAIPRGAKHKRAAKEFIRFATSPGPLADQAHWIPYGPARRSAMALVGKHGELDLEMKPFLPTYEPNFATALAFDGAFWNANETALAERFADWVEGRQLPVQKEAALAR
jgi:putative spermidine/putrescine transport system substrate-binding protein